MIELVLSRAFLRNTHVSSMNIYLYFSRWIVSWHFHVPPVPFGLLQSIRTKTPGPGEMLSFFSRFQNEKFGHTSARTPSSSCAKPKRNFQIVKMVMNPISTDPPPRNPSRRHSISQFHGNPKTINQYLAKCTERRLFPSTSSGTHPKTLQKFERP